MSLTESELASQLLTAILSIVVEVEGTTVHLGDLNERADSLTFETVSEAENFAKGARMKAFNFYKQMIYDDRKNIREKLRKHNELDC